MPPTAAAQPAPQAPAPQHNAHLYSEEDYLARPEFTEPEIQRTNLAAVILQMHALKLGDIEAFPFVEPPDGRYVRVATGFDYGFTTLATVDLPEPAGPSIAITFIGSAP